MTDSASDWVRSSFVVEIGSNDGTLLQAVHGPGHEQCARYRPSNGNCAAGNRAAGIPTLEDVSHAGLARRRLGTTRVRLTLVSANNVFAHTEDLREFRCGPFIGLLADQGVFVFEVSYLVDGSRKALVRHHLSRARFVSCARRRWCGSSSRVGMRLFDAERVDTHGGSIRGYAARAIGKLIARQRCG